ncbi:MAG: hypothetical protein ACOCP8_04045 [archaeon]
MKLVPVKIKTNYQEYQMFIFKEYFEIKYPKKTKFSRWKGIIIKNGKRCSYSCSLDKPIDILQAMIKYIDLVKEGKVGETFYGE